MATPISSDLKSLLHEAPIIESPDSFLEKLKNINYLHRDFFGPKLFATGTSEDIIWKKYIPSENLTLREQLQKETDEWLEIS